MIGLILIGSSASDVYYHRFSKAETKRQMDEWNALVDGYISLQKDPRPRFEIELGAKIGPDGGPLYKRCEANDCSNVMGRDVEELKKCSGCKTVRIGLDLYTATP